MILFFVFFCATSIAIASKKDEKKYPTRVVYGGIINVSGSTIPDKENPFTLGYNLLPHICVITDKTYHNFLYGMGDNVIKNVNGYFFNRAKKLDVYISLSKNLNSAGGYLGMGLEKSIKQWDITFFPFVEIQKNINRNSNITQLNIGVHINMDTDMKIKKGIFSPRRY